MFAWLQAPICAWQAVVLLLVVPGAGDLAWFYFYRVVEPPIL